MSLRRSPEVQFVYDRSVAAQDRVEEILQQIKQEEAARGAPEASASAQVESPASYGGTSPKRPEGREGGPDAPDRE
jgi:hypothetical protein